MVLVQTATAASYGTTSYQRQPLMYRWTAAHDAIVSYPTLRLLQPTEFCPSSLTDRDFVICLTTGYSRLPTPKHFTCILQFWCGSRQPCKVVVKVSLSRSCHDLRCTVLCRMHRWMIGDVFNEDVLLVLDVVGTYAAHNVFSKSSIFHACKAALKKFF